MRGCSFAERVTWASAARPKSARLSRVLVQATASATTRPRRLRGGRGENGPYSAYLPYGWRGRGHALHCNAHDREGRRSQRLVPVADAGVPKEWILAAREAIRENEGAYNAGRRTWEHSADVLRCTACGRSMSVNYVPAKDRGYYRCSGRYNGGVENRSSMSRTIRAEVAEAEVWEFVYGALTDPALLAPGWRRGRRTKSPTRATRKRKWLRG